MTTTKAFFLSCLTAILITACGDSRPLGPEDGSVSADTTAPKADTTPIQPDSGPPPPDVGPEGDRCVVAIRVDNCCTAAQPARASAVAADPCLVLWPITYPVPAECEVQWDPQCALVDCAPSPPPTRVAQEINGQCQFVDECNTLDDCVLATDLRSCCSCDGAYPEALIEVDPCLLTSTMSAVPEACLPASCADVLCDVCQPPNHVRCTLGDDYNRCEAYWTN